jgi:hypothetical protein
MLPGTRSSDPEAAYYQTVEEFFVSRRGDPLTLSNADWFLIWKWRAAGLPLRVVLRGITDALDSHAHSWSRNRKVDRLSYCAAEVEAAAERWRRALALGEEEGVSAESALRGFADALEGARDLGPRSAPVARDLAAQMRARAQEWGKGGLGGTEGPPAQIASAGLLRTSATRSRASASSLRSDGIPARAMEPWLVEREASLRAALEDDMGRVAVDAIGEAVDRDLAPYRDRMPARVLEQVRMESLTRRVLEAHGLPRLSLFHL